ncbi:MAG: alpha/beta fold hydrolase [Rhodospirillaceae bacterium]|nr:alpha/beta fold hydrolase [Rhodospirillaceae bacterium]
MPWSRANGIDIFYDVAGAGPPLLLLHANPFDRTMWLYQVAHFSQRFTTVAIDLRGYGLSAKPETPFAFADMAADVVGVARDLGIERAALIGCSIGATLALQIALDHPALAAAIVLAGGESGNPPIFATLAADYAAKPIAAQRADHMRLIVDPPFAETALGRHLLSVFMASTPSLSGRAIAEIFRARSSVNLQHRLARVAAPTLVLNGERDVSLDSGRYTARHIPGAVHRIVPGGGHMCCFENPAAFDACVAEFLSAVGYGAG